MWDSTNYIIIFPKHGLRILLGTKKNNRNFKSKFNLKICAIHFLQTILALSSHI